jgi:O-antigen ligase
MKKCKNPNLVIWGSIFISLINIPLAIFEVIAQPSWGSLVDWRGLRIFGNLFWHNSYSVYLLPHVLILYSALRVKFSKWMLFFFIVLLAANILTLSRSGLLSLAMGMLIFEFLFQSGSKQKLKGVFLVLLFLLAFIAYAFSSLQESRIGLSAIRERTGIWASIFPLMNNPIFGNGLGSYELYRGEVAGSLSPHNYYLGLIFELGFVGLLIVGLFLYSIIKSFRNKLKVKNSRVTGAIGLSLVISLMIYSFAGGAAFSQVVALNSWVILGCLMIKNDDGGLVKNEKNTIPPA